MAFNRNETLPDWLRRKGFLTLRDAAERKIMPHHARQILPVEGIPRSADLPSFLYTTTPPTLAEVIAADPDQPYSDRKARVLYRRPRREQIFVTTEGEALDQTVERLTAYLQYARVNPKFGDHLDGFTELLTNLYLIGAPERREAITALAERLLAYAHAYEVKMFMTDKRSDLYTGVQMLHTLGIMNKQFGGEFQEAINRISVTDSREAAVAWYADAPHNRKIILPDDQVMSGIQSREMHKRLFKLGADVGVDAQKMREGVEMMLIAGRPPDRDHEDLYRTGSTDFNVYAYYRTLGIEGINFQDVVPILSTHCPGHFGFTYPLLQLFKDFATTFGPDVVEPPIFHQNWTVKPYDTDSTGNFLYPEFQQQWEYVQGMLGDRMALVPQAGSNR